jgi:hypothetical protein
MSDRGRPRMMDRAPMDRAVPQPANDFFTERYGANADIYRKANESPPQERAVMDRSRPMPSRGPMPMIPGGRGGLSDKYNRLTPYEKYEYFRPQRQTGPEWDNTRPRFKPGSVGATLGPRGSTPFGPRPIGPYGSAGPRPMGPGGNPWADILAKWGNMPMIGRPQGPTLSAQAPQAGPTLAPQVRPMPTPGVGTAPRQRKPQNYSMFGQPMGFAAPPQRQTVASALRG